MNKDYESHYSNTDHRNHTFAKNVPGYDYAMCKNTDMRPPSPSSTTLLVVVVDFRKSPVSSNQSSNLPLYQLSAGNHAMASTIRD
jgi:hypothetical protein